jgi:hypothetical protein
MSAISKNYACLLALLLLLSFTARAETSAVNSKPREIPKAEKPIKLPDGPTHEGWELYVKNDFAGAEKSFLAVVERDGKNLWALEGLRSIYFALGDYKKVQEINLRMVKADPANILTAIFLTRAMDLLPYVESRAQMLQVFGEAAAVASPAVRSQLNDQIVTLYMRSDETEAAHKALEGLGYIDRWQFVAGPFGRKDKNDESVKPTLQLERRYAPERSLATLEFTDETGEKVEVRKDVPSAFRELNLDDLFHGANGVFYAFANLESASDQDVYMIFSTGGMYKVFLRGLPIVQEPGEEQFRRAGGDLVRVKLVKGSNPLLIKVTSSRFLVARLFGSDYGPPKDVRVAPLDKAGLEALQISPVRGLLMSEKAWGSTADYFLKKPAQAEQKTDGTTRLMELVNSGELTLPEVGWLDMALQRESENRARLALANTLAGSFPDSVGELDNAANMLTGAGRAMYDTASREAETARQYRERALSILPTSHQHLLSLYYFYNDAGLKEQAFTPLKACVDAHPDSATAQASLGHAFVEKKFMVEAEKCFEKAAELDAAILPRLVWFHEYHGNRERSRELYKKELAIGLIDKTAQFENALRHNELDTAASILESQEKNYPERATEWQHMKVRLLIEKGSLKDAYSLQKKIYEAEPEYDPQRRSTLEELVDLAIRLEKNDDAKTLLSSYLKENQGDFEFRRQLQDLEGTSPQAEWWEAYDVKVPQIDTSAFTAAKYKNANHAEIVDFMITRLLPDLSRESYTHVAQKVLNNQGIGELSELLVQSQRQDIVFVRTLNPDGSSFRPQNVHSFNLAQTASLYKVGPGSILEHAYLSQEQANKENPTLSMGFNFNAIDSPRAVSRWIVMIPDALKDKLNIRKIRPEMIDEQILPGPTGYTVYQWTNKYVEGVKGERFMPVAADMESVPLIYVESPDDPERANRWLTYRERDFIPTEAAEQARALVKDIDPKNEKARFSAILAYVRDKIQISNDSRTLDDVWFLKAGSHAQLTSLAREMARSVSLNVSTAYVNASYQPGRVWHSKNAKHNWEPHELDAFGNGGHMLVLEQSSGPDVWAQFSGNSPRYYDYFATNMNQSGTLALVLDNGGKNGTRMKRVHGEELGYVTQRLRVKVTLDGQGTGTINGEMQYFGTTGGFLRELFADPQRGPRTKEMIVRQSWPKIKIEKTTINAENKPEEPLGVTYSGTISNLASLAGTSYFLPPFVRGAGLLELQGPPERQSDILVKNEFSDLDHTITYVAPEGFAWTEIPDGQFICTEFGLYLADFKVNGRVLTCTRSYLVPSQRITPEKYPKLLEFLTKISSLQQQRIAYGPVEAKSFGNTREILSVGYSGFGESAPQAPAESGKK